MKSSVYVINVKLFQLKTCGYINKMFNVSPMVTTHKKIYIRQTKDKDKRIKAHQYKKLSNHKEIQEERKKRNIKQKKTINKVAKGSPYYLKITRNINELYSLIKRHRSG